MAKPHGVSCLQKPTDSTLLTVSTYQIFDEQLCGLSWLHIQLYSHLQCCFLLALHFFAPRVFCLAFYSLYCANCTLLQYSRVCMSYYLLNTFKHKTGKTHMYMYEIVCILLHCACQHARNMYITILHRTSIPTLKPVLFLDC